MKITPSKWQELKALPLFAGKVVSDSMEPVIKVGEKIVVKVGEKNLRRFDIIVIYLDEKLVCHYLWQKNKVVRPILLQTRNLKGDFDYPVKEECYLGKVISHRLGFFRKLRLLF